MFVPSHFSRVWHIVTLWIVARQAPLSKGFSRQEYWSGLPCPPPRNLPDPGIEPKSLKLPALVDRFFTTHATWKHYEHATYYAISFLENHFLSFLQTRKQSLTLVQGWDLNLPLTLLGFSDRSVVKTPPPRYKRCRRHRFNPWVGKSPWRRKRLPTPVFLPGKAHGQRSLGATIHEVVKN